MLEGNFTLKVLFPVKLLLVSNIRPWLDDTADEPENTVSLLLTPAFCNPLIRLTSTEPLFTGTWELLG